MDRALLGILFSLTFGYLPMFLFAALVYWSDRYEKEPKRLLGGAFLWGAVVAAGGAFIINTILGIGVYIFTGSEAATELTTGSLIAPVVEELLKGLAVLGVFLMFYHEFDTIFDGMVYAAITALGFAATENAYYIYTFGVAENGLSGGLLIAFIRVILVGWQHPFYSVFTGIGLAIARLNHRWSIKIIAPLAGLSLGILAHSFHNTLAHLLHGLGGLAATTLLDWSGWLIMLIFAFWALYRERRWIVLQLPEEVSQGVMTRAQYQVACSARAQMIARLNALFSGRFRATNRFYQATAELAYKKHQFAAYGNERGNLEAIEKLRAELARLSPFAGV